MEGLSRYSTNAINTSAASYSSSAVSPHHLQQQQQQTSASAPQTLPPLQPNHQAMQQPQPAYSGYALPPRNTATPTSAAPSTNGSMSYPPPPQGSGRAAPYSVMNNNPYSSQYPTTSGVMSSATTAAAHPQPIAPAPSSAGVGRAPPVLRPMPATGVMPQQGMNSPYGQSPLMQQQQMLPGEDQPTHVVGSQGRRGILPSAPGRPAAPAAGTAGKTPIPAKDADGKFPCPHCTKTYLHAKHLKRHLLRHTGDRPYMCVLCRDTFSRSDILKRHFIKCSVRRGNPTGATHLSHPQAHVKKNPTGQKAMTDGDVGHLNGMGNMPGEPMVHPFGLVQTSEGLSNIANDQAQLSRSSSIQRLDDANRDRRSMNGSVLGGSTRGGSFDQPYNGNDVSNLNPQINGYNVAQTQNGMPMFGGSGSDWTQMFQAGAHPTFVNSFSPPNHGQARTAKNNETNAHAARAVGISAGNPTDSIDSPTWGVSPAHPHSYTQLSDKIIPFLQPAGAPASTCDLVALVFRPPYIRQLLDNYIHFHTHFSMLHLPTFNVMEAWVGLSAGMCCVGACYSNILSAADIRAIMESFGRALEVSSHLFSCLTQDPRSSYQIPPFGSGKTDVDELQAIMLRHVLNTWNGTPAQREKARIIFPLIASFVRRSGLLQLPSARSLCSPTHHPDFSPHTFNTSTFDWASWIEQERRIRLLYFVFLSDTASGLYFNCGPEFDAFEIALPLPADDAAWDARDSSGCTEALGLHGPELARRRNRDGTRHCSQPGLHMVLNSLFNSHHQIRPSSTNLYGKFIMVHAILAILRRALVDGSAALLDRSNSPLLQADANLLGRETVMRFATVLEKFKSLWDNDMAIQFPPNTPVLSGRYGFSRDGIHFYWLARHMLKNTRTVDLQLPADQRFAHIMHVLKSVKTWVMSDGHSRGEEMGSVGDIDGAYGTTGPNLDMIQLFRPLSPPRSVKA